MNQKKVVNLETRKVAFRGSLEECQAFLKGMFFVDSSDGCMWESFFIE